MFEKFRKKVKQDHVTRKVFNYSKDGVNLSFTLRVDIKKELEVFKELLTEAIKEISEELNK